MIKAPKKEIERIPEIRVIISEFNFSYVALLSLVKFPQICLPVCTIKVLTVKLLTFPCFIAQSIKFMLQPFSHFDNISNSYIGGRKVHVG